MFFSVTFKAAKISIHQLLRGRNMRFSSNVNVAPAQKRGQNGSKSDISAYFLKYLGGRYIKQN